MLFHSQLFLVFFGVVFALYWSLPNQRLRKILLLVSSCVFYMSWNPAFILLIVFSCSIDYFAARVIEKHSSPARRKFVLFASIAINVALLAYFKYVNFFIENFVYLFKLLGIPASLSTLQIILPLGISFYTFETISYVVDVYRRKIPACKSYLDYAVFIMFFPHLIAGPIVRARDFLPQLSRYRKLCWFSLSIGIQFFILGLFKKVILGDHLALISDPVFANPQSFNTSIVWLGLLAYTAQIYCDFSGYSDMAIGLALMLGIKLKRNFDLPYLSKNISEYWRRWHISLATWMRDYIFIPLGGSRGTVAKTMWNILVTLLICGAWHGAGWKFVVFGLYHAVCLGVYHLMKKPLSGIRIPNAICITTTILVVAFGFVIFRTQDLNQAMVFYVRLFTLRLGSALEPALLTTSFFCLLALFAGYVVAGRYQMAKLPKLSPPVMATTLACALALILELWPVEKNPFIYFQF